MANSMQRSGTNRQWLENKAIMGVFALMKLLPYRSRNRLMGASLRGFMGNIIGYRKRIMNNLNLIYPNMVQERKTEIADQVLDNAGRTFIENVYPAAFLVNNLEVELWGEGLEEVLKAHAIRRPIMFYSGHFGNHEAFRAALFQRGIKVGGMVRRMANPYFDINYKNMLDIDGRSGPVFEAHPKGTLGFFKALKTGSALVLLIDLAVSNGKFINFMGKPACTSLTAANFALKSNALFLPYFSMRNPDSESFRVEIGVPIDHSDPLTMTQEATKSLEDRITKDPGNWFWIHRRWKHSPQF
jgi:KDO2-lipid IV(A) lauroyltransferase